MSPMVAFARICTTGSTSFDCTFRPCANEAKTSLGWSSACSLNVPGAEVEPGGGTDLPDEVPPLEIYLSQCEKRYIADALRTNAGRIGVSAEKLSISRKSLWERMKRLAIGPQECDEDR